MRAFIAYDLPNEIKEIINKRIPRFDGIKYVKKENLHLTLKFLGEVEEDEIKEYEELINSVKLYKIHSKITNIGFFPSENFIKVVWIGSEGDFNDELIKKLKVNNFIPHITVGRVKIKLEENEIKKFENIKFNREFDIKYLTIYKSNLTPSGPVYEQIKRYEL